MRLKCVVRQRYSNAEAAECLRYSLHFLAAACRRHASDEADAPAADAELRCPIEMRVCPHA